MGLSRRRGTLRCRWPYGGPLRTLLMLAGIACLGGPAVADEVAGNPELAETLRWSRVRVKMEVRGDLFAPVGGDGQEIRRPFSSTARFDFLEAASGPESPEPTATSTQAAAAVRHFLSAASELTIGGAVTRRSLRPSMTTLAVIREPAIRYGGIGSTLTREEADLLSLSFDPLLLDRLATDAPGAENSPEWVAAVLSIDTIGKPEGETSSSEKAPLGLRAERSKAAEKEGADRILLSGTVEGAADGVPTTLVIDGSLDVGPAGGSVRQGFVKVRERRLAGHVSPGFDCEATIQFARRPADVTVDPPADASARSAVESAWRRIAEAGQAVTADRLSHRDRAGRYALEHDARWREVSDDSRGLVLRMVDDGALLAECTVAALPPSAPGTTLEGFKEDVARTLGGSLGRVVSTDDSTREDGCRHLRVVSEGAEGEVPLEWRHHLLEDASGRRVAATFVVERRFVGRFGEADADFVARTVVFPDAAP